jgi:hypothetical protein
VLGVTLDRRVGAALLVIALWIPLFIAGMALHEMLHAAAVLLLGSHPVLVLRPWPFMFLPITTTGIHVQAVPALDPLRQALDNFMGPGLAAALFGLAALNVPRGAVRTALVANVLGLVFFAAIELADVALDGRLEDGLLTAPEFNYGVPLLIALIAAVRSAGGKTRPAILRA